MTIRRYGLRPAFGRPQPVHDHARRRPSAGLRPASARPGVAFHVGSMTMRGDGKHRQGYAPVKVAVTVGAGKIRSVTFYHGEMTKEKYGTMIRDHWSYDILEVAKDSRISPGEVFFMRDNDPKSRDIFAERDAGFRVIAQEPDSPDTNCLDYSIWNRVDKTMWLEELEWMEAHPAREWTETQIQFEARLEMHLLSLPSSYIRKTMASLKRRCRDIVAKDGDLLTND